MSPATDPSPFDSTSDPQRQQLGSRQDAWNAVGCGVLMLEVIALVAVFGVWYESGLNFDPGKTVLFDSLWGYLAAAGGIGVFALGMAAISARKGARGAAVSQGAMAALICLLVLGGAVVQSHEDARCRDLPNASGCPD